jgi:hypothetical protein
MYVVRTCYWEANPGFVSSHSFYPPPLPNGHALETRLYSSVFFSLFPVSMARYSLTLFRNGRRSQLIFYRVEEVLGSECILFFYPISWNLKNLLSIFHFLCLHLVLDGMLHITTRCLVLISYRLDIYHSGS